MNRREIVLGALSHKNTTPIPYHIDFTVQSLERLVEYTKDADIEEKLGGYLHYTQYWGWPTELPDKPGHFQDEFGVVWNRTVDKDIGVVERPQIEDIENISYQFPVPDTARLRKDIEKLIATKKDRFTFMGFGFCMFERAWSLMGMENVLMSMIACPEALEDFFDRICDYYLALVDIALEYDIDGVYFGDDWGQQQGLIMGAGHWRRFLKPRMTRLYERVKSRGKFVIQHSCGNNREIFDDLAEIGLDCYQTFQPEIYDIAETKRLFGDKLSFWGGVSTQRILPFLSPQGVKDEIVRVVKVLRPNGGLIIGPTHAIPPDVPPENILAMIDVFQNQDRFF
ncbi:MAG: uroporphyrinogen decarboxylase [Spirochaetes bacterium]|nr:uroporphyrinogen decarboxylase [Spirochaetota bacterium]